MRGKKGLDYIDWSMSMGIFIIAIIALFVFLKPGARPEHDQDTLISIVEKNFLDQTQWFVHETPIFIKNFQDKWGSGADAVIDVRANGDIRFTALKPSPDNRFKQPIGKTPTKITLDCDTSCDNTNFMIIGTTKKIQETTNMELECTPKNQPTVCTALLGATITHQGLQQNEISNLKTADYTALKNTWTYPLQKEFALYQDGTKISGGQEPAAQANVFVKELKLDIISDQGTQTPTTINIRVW